MISVTSGAGAAALFTDIDRQVSPTEPDFETLLKVPSAHGLTVPLPPDLSRRPVVTARSADPPTEMRCTL
jgi:hypothetical protein